MIGIVRTAVHHLGCGYKVVIVTLIKHGSSKKF